MADSAGLRLDGEGIGEHVATIEEASFSSSDVQVVGYEKPSCEMVEMAIIGPRTQTGCSALHRFFVRT